MPDWLGSILSLAPWPFSLRPSLESLADPEKRRLVAMALMLLGTAVLLLTIAGMVRRGRLVAILLALALAAMQGRSLALLLVPATPTSYRPSPTGFTPIAITSGMRVFGTTCAPCHGKGGNGEGGLGTVANLLRPHIWTHPDGDLFWFITHGINRPDGAPSMPAFGTILSERTRWSLIDYVHALNVGAVSRGLDSWPHRVTAPALALSCPTIGASGMGDLAGKVVRVILGGPPPDVAAVPPVNGIAVVTVWLPGAVAEIAPIPGVDCVAHGGAEEAIAYAILAGSADGHVTPARFLIDQEGVLRSVWRKDDGEAWSDQERLLEEVRTICTEPLAVGSGGEHEHNH